MKFFIVSILTACLASPNIIKIKRTRPEVIHSNYTGVSDLTQPIKLGTGVHWVGGDLDFTAAHTYSSSLDSPIDLEICHQRGEIYEEFTRCLHQNKVGWMVSMPLQVSEEISCPEHNTCTLIANRTHQRSLHTSGISYLNTEITQRLLNPHLPPDLHLSKIGSTPTGFALTFSGPAVHHLVFKPICYFSGGIMIITAKGPKYSERERYYKACLPILTPDGYLDGVYHLNNTHTPPVKTFFE